MGLRSKLKSKVNETKLEGFVDPNEPKNVPAILIHRYMGPEIFLIFLGLIGSAGLGLIPVLLYFVLGDMIDLMGSASASSGVTTSAIVASAVQIMNSTKIQIAMNDSAKKMAYIAVGAFVAAAVQFFFLNFAHGRIGTRLKNAYFGSLLKQEIGYFDMKRTGQLINDMSENLDFIQEVHTTKVGEVTQNGAQCVFGLIMALVTGWKMALVMISIIPLFFVVLFFNGMGMAIFQKIINRISGNAASVSNEVISAMRTIRSMDGEERETRRFHKLLVQIHPVYLLRGIMLAICVGTAIFLNWGNIALGFWWGGVLIVRGELTFGEMFQVFGFVLMGVIAIAMSLRTFPDFSKAAQSEKELLKVIRRIPMMRPSGGIQPEKIVGHIEFKHVTFSYPTRPHIEVLKNFSLEIKPGQAVALVGSSGSGKSTIIGLLERFYQHQSGDIFLDGVKLDDIDPRWVHRNIGIVTQEPTLFAATIRENILYAVQQSGRNITEEDVINASKAANAHEFITALPDGYNTMLGERGVSMSGGQKQRIAIARAMIQDPKLLLLDEATSALDTQSEGVVQDALNKLMAGRTTIVIAHRLSTVIDSDVIVVMHKGELKEKGTHHELMQIKDGYYFKLAAKQMNYGQAASSQSNLEESSDESTADKDSDQIALNVNQE
jgi:ATP-binding cassette subfamily B (MDR/TAP) protein 1